ncbi:DUF3889 domain-containing protein [Gracilibacillus sp. YIM 98692]|uniref:DUF3889 domain-containing protein n=1 Tax=Gracilibacillus sp. YIM 98692 TaxID=2663532 RepID=UPI0013D80593|nr:DUF3889 domain-containing protein [Gracilibacillus sp. YIM 98692]
MYPYYRNDGYPYHPAQPMYDPYVYPQAYSAMPHDGLERQNFIQGQATWTEGGNVTQCGIPWSYSQYMTAAVSTNSPYQCGQTIKVRNPQTSRVIIVTVVDTVPGTPATRINLHRRAFEALGANPSVGVINVTFQPSPELEQEKWGKYLLEVTQVAYPNYNVTDYNFIERTQPAANQVKETYEYSLQSPQEQIKVRGTVTYNPRTDRIVSFDIKEVS